MNPTIPSFYKFREITPEGAPHRVFQSNKNELPKSYLESLFKIFSKSEATPNYTYTFYTSQQQKYDEVNKLLKGLNIVRHDKDLPTRENEENLTYLAVYHVFKAYKECKTPCFTEEAGLYAENDKYKQPWPGHYWRHVVENQQGNRSFAKEYQGCQAIARSCFAYTEDGITAHVFSGEIKGRIVSPKNWVETDGWDPFFQPAGHTQTLAELSQFKHLFNMRLMPCAEMRSVMRGKDYPGVYEVHITVGNDNNPKPTHEHIEKFKTACATLGQKPLVIGMDDPQKPMQLQTAAYLVFEGYQDAVKRTHGLAEDFLKKDFKILRVRIEAMLHNQDSPKTDEAALEADPGNYFELHARLESVAKDRFHDFETILKHYNQEKIGSHGKGRLSAVFSTVGETSRYFVNMRSYNIGAITTLKLWRELLGELEKNGFAIAKEVKPEYCIYDEEPTLDQQKV